jgi:NitT/TauT family transport system substrate-binding protein
MRKFSIALATLLVALSVSMSRSRAADTKMILATGVDPGFSHFYVAVKEGFLKKNGIDADLQTGPAGGAMVPLVVSNQANAAAAAALPGLNNHLLDSDVVAVAQIVTYNHAFGIVSRSNIKTVQDLDGHKIGITLGTASESLWLALLKKNDLNVDEYNKGAVNIDPPEMLAAIQRGDIDAFSSWEPWISRTIMAVPNTHVLVDQYDVLRDLGFIYMNKQWISANRDAAVRFMKAMVETDEFIHSHPQQTKKIDGDLLNLSPELMDSIFSKMDFSMKLDQSTFALNKQFVDQLKARGRIKGDFDYNSWFYPDLLQDVAPDRVALPH